MIRDPARNVKHEGFMDRVQRGNCFMGFVSSTKGHVRVNVYIYRTGPWQSIRVVCNVRK
jgi:hypothetical protein